MPPAGAGTTEVAAAVAALAQADMAADRKGTALKALQGHIWHGGFQSGELVARMYDDVAPALEGWAAAGIKVYIYSSGSRRVSPSSPPHMQRTRFGKALRAKKVEKADGTESFPCNGGPSRSSSAVQSRSDWTSARPEFCCGALLP